MKRKTFIKQLMGVGVDRNMADLVADTARAKYGAYFKGLGLFLNTYALIRNGQDPLFLYRASGGGGA